MLYLKLKKLEIQGFKSFAYKTEIKIKDGITAIVGPNGSGKSNISDAIRWVLGEQSVKNLRGNKMEDVIFSGTSKKRALGYCQVTITFDNISGMIPLDYSEVAVTRRMFRSGESEYYLNKNSCRLKDIRELFMDTGIGKDGYSIIGQGRIDEILSDRPEDRRSIFEEAAGIVKYKSKKHQSEKKLDKTEDNITRIKDLIIELSSQKEVLEVQASKAKEFNKLHNKLKELEVNLFIIDIRKLNKEIKEINKEKYNLEEYLKSENLKSEEIQEDFNKIKLNIDKLEREIEVYRNENLESKEKIDKNNNELTILNEKESFYNKDLNRLVKEKKILNDKLEEFKQKDKEISIKIKTMEEKRKIFFADYKEKKEKFDCNNIKFRENEKEIEKEKDNVIKIYNNSSDIKSQLNSIVSFNENINKRIQQLNNDIDNRKKEIEEITFKYKEEIKNIEKLDEDLMLLNAEFVKVEESEKDNKRNLAVLIEKINNNNNQIGSKLSRLKLLENMEEDYEGYYQGVKSILVRSKKDKKISNSLIGVVAELLKIDPKYEKAIEMALGSNSQNIVTPTELDAKILIEYLKNNKLGRITCLPSDIIKANTINLNESDKKDYNIIGLGHELIEYDLNYENIFKYLLGRTIIIKDIDNAIKFANKYKHRYKIITLDGDVLNPGGSLSGGSNYKNKVNIITRKNRINELKDEIKNFEDIKITLKNKKIIYDNKINNIDMETEKLKEKIKEKEHKIIKSNNNKEKLLNEISMLKQLVEKTKEEIVGLKNEKRSYDEKIKELKTLLLRFEADMEIQKEKIQKLTTKFNEDKIEIEDKLNNLTEIKIETNEIENTIKNLEDKTNINKSEIRDIDNEILIKHELILGIRKDLKELNFKKINSIDLLKELNDIEKNTKFKLNSLIKDKNNYMNDFYSQQSSLLSINKTINQTEKKLNSLNIKLARNSVQLENYHKKLLDDYELELNEALKLEFEIKNIKEARNTVKILKDNIKRLGNINLGSIEEYKSLKTRLDFILNQQKDLINARETLKEIISDMEKKMENEFLINFKKINNNFKEIFKILFDGGIAELTLDNDKDILNSGININAQPPGKNLQNLSLLSGGEKSLTAVALLFSILNLKPAPFCILDEIDASLDESNINKYTNYLKTLANDTQFVLITHRKTTMEIVDVLYGVAMEEEGVSKLISIKLEDYIKEIAS